MFVRKIWIYNIDGTCYTESCRSGKTNSEKDKNKQKIENKRKKKEKTKKE